MASGHGGRRPGAGRKKGSYNKVTAAALDLAADGISPVEFLMGIVRDDSQSLTTRTDAAKALLPYTAYRLQAVELNAEVKNLDVDGMTDAELVAAVRGEPEGE